MPDLVSKSSVLDIYAELYDAFDDNKAIQKELDKVYDKLRGLKEQEPDGMINKIKPIARVEWSGGEDGCDKRFYVAFRCPVCHRKLPGYNMVNACNQCGTFFDWGKQEPVIETIRGVEWDD